MYEIGKLVGEKRATDKFPEAKKAAVRRSRSVLSGMFAEQLAPYLPNFPFSPTEAKFIGAPIDFLVFKGMDAQHIEEVIFVEVKSGSARLNHNERSLKDAIINKRVRWHEYHVPAPLTHTPDAATRTRALINGRATSNKSPAKGGCGFNPHRTIPCGNREAKEGRGIGTASVRSTGGWGRKMPSSLLADDHV